jgi:hypothetical protein
MAVAMAMARQGRLLGLGYLFLSQLVRQAPTSSSGGGTRAPESRVKNNRTRGERRELRPLLP